MDPPWQSMSAPRLPDDLLIHIINLTLASALDTLDLPPPKATEDADMSLKQAAMTFAPINKLSFQTVRRFLTSASAKPRSELADTEKRLRRHEKNSKAAACNEKPQSCEICSNHPGTIFELRKCATVFSPVVEGMFRVVRHERFKAHLRMTPPNLNKRIYMNIINKMRNRGKISENHFLKMQSNFGKAGEAQRRGQAGGVAKSWETGEKFIQLVSADESLVGAIKREWNVRNSRSVRNPTLREHLLSR